MLDGREGGGEIEKDRLRPDEMPRSREPSAKNGVSRVPRPDALLVHKQPAGNFMNSWSTRRPFLCALDRYLFV